MVQIIDGKAVAASVKQSVKERVSKMKEETGKTPGLAVIILGNRHDSQTYVRNKRRACDELGMNSFVYELPDTSSEEDILAIVDELNHREDVHGILIQLPLPPHIRQSKVLDAICLEKDVDGFNPINVGAICMKGRDPTFVSCTPLGVIKMLDYYNIQIEGKHAVVIGRSNIVGLPVAMLLMNRNATVTMCHSYTQNLKEITRTADIIIAAVAKPKFVTADMVKEGAVIIDVGTNSVESPTSKHGYKLVGDVDFENVKDKCSYISPVPGGVGPMTIAMLMDSTCESAYRFFYNKNPAN